MSVTRCFDGTGCPMCESDRFKSRITDDGQDRECMECGTRWKWRPKTEKRRPVNGEFMFFKPGAV